MLVRYRLSYKFLIRITILTKKATTELRIPWWNANFVWRTNKRVYNHESISIFSLSRWDSYSSLDHITWQCGTIEIVSFVFFRVSAAHFIFDDHMTMQYLRIICCCFLFIRGIYFKWCFGSSRRESAHCTHTNCVFIKCKDFWFEGKTFIGNLSILELLIIVA